MNRSTSTTTQTSSSRRSSGRIQTENLKERVDYAIKAGRPKGRDSGQKRATKDGKDQARAEIKKNLDKLTRKAAADGAKSARYDATVKAARKMAYATYARQIQDEARKLAYEQEIKKLQEETAGQAEIIKGIQKFKLNGGRNNNRTSRRRNSYSTRSRRNSTSRTSNSRNSYSRRSSSHQDSHKKPKVHSRHSEAERNRLMERYQYIIGMSEDNKNKFLKVWNENRLDDSGSKGCHFVRDNGKFCALKSEDRKKFCYRHAKAGPIQMKMRKKDKVNIVSIGDLEKKIDALFVTLTELQNKYEPRILGKIWPGKNDNKLRINRRDLDKVQKLGREYRSLLGQFQYLKMSLPKKDTRKHKLVANDSLIKFLERFDE